jgi:hypothetical protein
MIALTHNDGKGLSRRALLAGSAGLTFAIALGIGPEVEQALAAGTDRKLNAYIRSRRMGPSPS